MAGLVRRCHREWRNFPRVGPFHRFLYIFEHLELWNASARNLANAPFDREETLNIWRGTGYEYAWIHGYTGSILRTTFRNILENTDTNKNNCLKLSNWSLKFTLSCWSKRAKDGRVRVEGGGVGPVTSAGGPAPHVHGVPWGCGAEGACPACWCRAEMLTALWLQWSPQ